MAFQDEMKLLSVLICLLSFYQCVVGNDVQNAGNVLKVENCGKRSLPNRISDRIIGGEKAKHGRHPWMIALYEKYAFGWGWREEFQFNCGGAILNENWIVTAASCFWFPGQVFRYIVMTGLYKLSEPDGPTVTRHTVSKIVIHSKFNRDYSRELYNIALVKLKKPIDFAGSQGYTNAICLPEDDDEPAGFATVTGWGLTQEIPLDRENQPDVLQEIKLPIIPVDTCKSYAKNICAGEKGKNICSYDGGSPLVQTDYRGISSLLGIAATSYSCGETGKAAEFTRMSAHMDWIAKVVAEN